MFECLANPLNRRRASVAILAAACVAACSGDTITGPNRAPEGTGTIGDQSLEPGESTTFDIAGYFTDPDGDRLTYTAESTHSGQATASMSGSMLTISGVAAGEPSVIVTATDPGGLFALQSTNVSVRPPNRAPVPVGSIPGVSVDAGSPVELDAIWYFRDPDGDQLDYQAVSQDEAVVTAAASGSMVTITAVASGVTSVSVTATDPGGLSATQEIQVQAIAGTAGFRDDFDSGLEGWQVAESSAEISEGVLQLTNSAAASPGRAVRALDQSLTNWQADFRAGRAHEDAAVRVVFHTAMTDIPSFAVEIGSGVATRGQDTNIRFLILPRDAGGWQPVFAADSDLIADSIGEFTEITVAFKQLRVNVAVGGQTLYGEDLGSQGFPPELGILKGVELWVVPLGGAAERTALYDWIAVAGTPVSGGGSRAGGG